MSAALEKARICGIICAGILLKGKIKRLCRFRAMRGCAIDGLAKMFVRAHIFASWYNCLRRMLFCSLRGLCPQPCLRHGLGSDGFAKMFVQAHIFASWYNCLRRMLLCSLRGLCPQPCLRHGLGIDGLAKMPLRASIFASWYNIRRKNC